MAERKKTPAQKKKEAERISEAVDYKLQGHPYEQIAEQMKLPVNEVVGLVHEGLTTLIRDSSDKKILLDLQRIDQMITAVYPGAAQGDHNAIHIVINLRKEREALEMKLQRQESFRALAPEDNDDNP